MMTEPWTSKAPNASPVLLCSAVGTCPPPTRARLVDGVNVTTSDEHMWLVPFSEGQDHLLTVTLDAPQQISGIRVWNYNKTPEDTFRGVRGSRAGRPSDRSSSQSLPTSPSLVLSLRLRLFTCGWMDSWFPLHLVCC